MAMCKSGLVYIVQNLPTMPKNFKFVSGRVEVEDGWMGVGHAGVNEQNINA